MTEYQGYKLQRLTAREEIAGRILASLVTRYGEAAAETSADSALRITDMFFAKTRPEEGTANKPTETEE